METYRRPLDGCYSEMASVDSEKATIACTAPTDIHFQLRDLFA